jgi:uncharacterized protein
MNEFDNVSVNPISRACVTDLKSPLRRRLVLGSAMATLFGSAPLHSAANSRARSFSFESVSMRQAADTICLPPGYSWAVVAAWGDPIDGKGKSISVNASDSSSDQEKQFGMHHDGGAFFPEDGSSNRGLWVVNHEYVDDGLLHTDGISTWSAEKVRKCQAAHGVTVALIEREANGVWRVLPSEKARRVTAFTPCLISGPAAGHILMQTKADPEGAIVLGTLNNCAHGVTPWGTYLTCEENFNGYFYKSATTTKEEQRVGLNATGFGYRWHEFDERFNADVHPNEPNRFGWVVEIDPQNPEAAPVKRTALGRFKHEGAWVTLARDGRVVVYMGDDQRNEYVYKFVSSKKYSAKNPQSSIGILDSGTLYVARFDPNGSGRWVSLTHGKNGLTAENGFADQAYILINARLAADHVGATPMDRPEWVAVHPKLGDVYVSLTNNSDRGVKTPVNAANPRPRNVMGHILRWRENGRDAASLEFKWDIFVLAGDPALPDIETRGTVMGDGFGSPDGLWFDPRGILWVQTDISAGSLGRGAYQNLPNNCMLAVDPRDQEFRRFLIGPRNCEITGVDLTPDLRTMFVNIQHPGEKSRARSDPGNPRAISSWPDAETTGRPRSATIAIWRDDGKTVGA